MVTAASNTASRLAPSSGSGYLPLGQATSLPDTGPLLACQASLFIAQPATASGSVNPSISSNHIGRHAASAICTCFSQTNWDLQDNIQTLAFRGHANDAMTHSPWPFLLSHILPQFSLGKGSPALGQPLSFHQQQQLQAGITTGLPKAPQHSAMDNTFYNKAGLTNISAPRTLPLYSAQTATSTPSMATDMANMAKVIPNVLLKLQ